MSMSFISVAITIVMVIVYFAFDNIGKGDIALAFILFGALCWWIGFSMGLDCGAGGR